MWRVLALCLRCLADIQIEIPWNENMWNSILTTNNSWPVLKYDKWIQKHLSETAHYLYILASVKKLLFIGSAVLEILIWFIFLEIKAQLGFKITWAIKHRQSSKFVTFRIKLWSDFRLLIKIYWQHII